MSGMQVRKAAFEGSFYPRGKAKVEFMIEKLMGMAKVNIDVADAVAYVAPHAGYQYSGRTAAHTFTAMRMNRNYGAIDDVIVVGPNHTGVGTAVSVSLIDWETPLGTAETDTEFAKAICEASHIAEQDETAHYGEHSIEVQLPFLLHEHIARRYAFVCMGDQSIEACMDLAGAIGKAVDSTGRNALVLASSDFNHYESADMGKRKDTELFGILHDLDYQTFNRRVYEIQDSACGYGPITVAAMYAKGRGASQGILLNYSNSGDVTQEFDEVVDYASFAFV